MSAGKVYFVGGGPGAPDLLTLRGARAIAAADVVIWGRSLLMEEVVTEHAPEHAELLPWPPATMAQILATYDRAKEEGLVVARLHAGDPTIYGKVHREIQEVSARGLPYELVPGVSALGAAAAALGRELTAPGAPRSLILASHGERDAPPPGQRVRELARHGATMALFMSAKRPYELADELLQGGYGPDTPCAVVHRASWPEEAVLTCRLDELGDRLSGREQTLILVGPALTESAPLHGPG